MVPDSNDEQHVSRVERQFSEAGYELHFDEDRQAGTWRAAYVRPGSTHRNAGFGSGRTRLEAAMDAWGRYVAEQPPPS